MSEFMRRTKLPSYCTTLFFGVFVAFVVTKDSGIAATPDYKTSGEQANALLCRPNTNGPFPVVIWSHGRVEKDKRGGWQRLCEALASEGVLAFVPIRETERGLTPRDIPYNKAELSRAIDYIKSLPDVDPSRMALMGHSRGGLLTLMVGLERTDLKALIITAPADIRPYFQQSVSQASRVNVPLLLLVEEGDEMGSVGAVNSLDKALKDHGKEARTIRYNRGGGHFLFVRKGYWWDDLRVFLRENLLTGQ